MITSDKLKFYVRYVDDTLVLAKPEDIPLILDKLNSFHPQIQFKYEEFVDHNDVHFLDIKFDSQGTTIYRKSTHTGQYRHYSSFTPWSRKVAWIRALVHRATKICSTQQLLQLEILTIKRFASWNGFPRWMCDKLINIPTALPKVLKLHLVAKNLNPPFLLSGSDCHSLDRKAISFYETAPERFPAYSNSR